MANPNYFLRSGVLLALLAAFVAVGAAPAKKRPVKKTDASAANAAKDAIPADDDPETAPRLGEAKITRFRVGAEISAVNGPCRGIVAMVTIPLDCPEQKVTIVS